VRKTPRENPETLVISNNRNDSSDSKSGGWQEESRGKDLTIECERLTRPGDGNGSGGGERLRSEQVNAGMQSVQPTDLQGCLLCGLNINQNTAAWASSSDDSDYCRRNSRSPHQSRTSSTTLVTSTLYCD
jgi:hypothetical protein